MARHNTHGIQLKMGDGAATEVFTTVAQVTDITPPQGRRGFTPVAEHDMTNTIRKVFDALRDEGQVTLSLNFDPAHATHDAVTGVNAAFRAGTTKNWQMVFPDTGALQASFAAVITDFRFNPYPANSGVGSATLTLEIDGAITWTP